MKQRPQPSRKATHPFLKPVPDRLRVWKRRREDDEDDNTPRGVVILAVWTTEGGRQQVREYPIVRRRAQRAPKCSPPANYWETLPSFLSSVKDMYALCSTLLDFNCTLKYLLDHHVEGLKREQQTMAEAIYAETLFSLTPEALLGFHSSGEFFKRATIDRFPEAVRKLAAAESQIKIAIARLATFEYSVWVGEDTLLRGMTAVSTMIRPDGSQTVPPDTPWFLRFLLLHRWSLRMRAAARDRLQREISRLSTPRLRAIDYRKDFYYSLLDGASEPFPLGSSTPGIAFIAQRLAVLELESDNADEPLDRDNTVCPICRENLSVDPRQEEGQAAKPQLLIYTYPCCNRPYHVCCLLSWMDVKSCLCCSTGSCPTCREVLGCEFAIDLLQRRTVELGTL